MEKLKLFIKSHKDYNPASAILVTVGGYFAAQIFGGILVVSYGSVKGWNSEQIVDNLGDSVWLSLAFSIAIYGFYVFIVHAFLRLSKLSLRDIGLKWPKAKIDILIYVLAGYAVYFVSQIIATVIIKNNVPAIDLNQKQELGFNTYTTGFGLVPIFIALVIIPPIVEEIITRGFLYTGLRKGLNIWWAGVITSVIFGAAHLQWGGSAPLLWAAAIDTFLLSAILIYIREKTDSLYPPIGLHMLKNFMAFLGIFIFHLA